MPLESGRYFLIVSVGKNANCVLHHILESPYCSKYMGFRTIKTVKSIGKTFASLGVGSSFMHGSLTKVGDSCDRRVNDLFGCL